MNIIATAQVVFSLVPVVTSAVHTAEQTWGAGNGAVKLKWVLETVETIFNQAAASAQHIDPDFPKYESLVKTITSMVASAVSVYNAAGVFLKSAKAA